VEAPMTTALLMIDIQQGMWMEPKPPHNDKAFLKNAASLLEKARAARIPVIHIRHDGGDGDPLRARRRSPSITAVRSVTPASIRS
jgi:nicotinamidase-related amidase